VSDLVDDAIRTYRELAVRWDLAGPRREIEATLDGLPVEQRAYVPTQLSRSLHMFLNSYGPDSAQWGGSPP
jgi:hypothetical protein